MHGFVRLWIICICVYLSLCVCIYCVRERERGRERERDRNHQANFWNQSSISKCVHYLSKRTHENTHVHWYYRCVRVSFVYVCRCVCEFVCMCRCVCVTKIFIQKYIYIYIYIYINFWNWIACVLFFFSYIFSCRHTPISIMFACMYVCLMCVPICMCK